MATGSSTDRTATSAGTDAQKFRHTLAEFASGVTIITAGDAGEPFGFACQSFSSVSLDPPLVLFCVDSRSRTWPRIESAGHFVVNVLAEDQREFCERFGSSKGKRFEGLDCEWTDWGAPALPEVLARIHADVATVHTEGDHEVVVGRVVSLETVRRGKPLIFFRGGFDSEDHHADLAKVWGWLDGWN
jgi:3-hydroxy-9,10-secoandrosta-1,3,5(10)-triene-9,17-dione monooxygenase reductase component